MNDRSGNDFLDEIVPESHRQAAWKPLTVWVGFIVVVGIMAVGGGLAGQLDREEFVRAVLFGNFILAIFAAFSGWIGAQSGKTFGQLTTEAFGEKGWRLVSLYVPIVLIGWFGVEAAIFGNVIGELLGLEKGERWWLMSGATLMFATTSYLGFSAIRVASTALVPIIVGLSLYAVLNVYDPEKASFGFDSNTLSFGVAVNMVMSSWIMGVLTCVPDLTRFARTPLVGALIASIGVFLANCFTFFIGGFAAAATGESDPARLLVSIGVLPAAVFFALANIWTTNDNNMYSAALNVARLASISRRHAVLLCALIAAIFAAFDPTSISSLFTFLAFMGSTAPALGGVVLGAYFTKKGREKNTQRIKWEAWAGWIGGSLTANLVNPEWSIPLGFITGWAIWALVYKLFFKKLTV